MTPGRSRAIRWVVGGLALAVVLYFFPLFHIVSLKGAQEEAAAARFDPAEYVETFWNGPLLDAASDAVDAAELLAAFEQDFDAAATRYGHKLGLSGHSSYLVSGQGTIVGVDDYSIAISLQENAPAQVVIEIGPVFGNAIRDGSGLLDVSEFDNAQDFNALSAEINLRVEGQVLPQLQAGAGVGKTLRFVGGTDVRDSGGAPTELVVVPLLVEYR